MKMINKILLLFVRLYSDDKCHIWDMFVSLHHWLMFPKEIFLLFVIRILMNDCSSLNEHYHRQLIHCRVPVQEFLSLDYLDVESIVVDVFHVVFDHFHVYLRSIIRTANRFHFHYLFSSIFDVQYKSIILHPVRLSRIDVCKETNERSIDRRNRSTQLLTIAKHR